MKADIVIKRPVNEGNEFIQFVMKYCQRYGYIHTLEKVDPKGGNVYHYFEKDKKEMK